MFEDEYRSMTVSEARCAVGLWSSPCQTNRELQCGAFWPDGSDCWGNELKTVTCDPHCCWNFRWHSLPLFGLCHKMGQKGSLWYEWYLMEDVFLGGCVKHLVRIKSLNPHFNPRGVAAFNNWETKRQRGWARCHICPASEGQSQDRTAEGFT